MLRSLDPYSEFEGIQEAVEMTESIEGKYGGVGLVISGVPTTTISSSSTTSKTSTATKLLKDAVPTPKGNNAMLTIRSIRQRIRILRRLRFRDDADDISLDQQIQEQIAAKQERHISKAQQLNSKVRIRVVSAFEGYAFDYRMRVGDKLISIDNEPLTNSDGDIIKYGIDCGVNRYDRTD